MFNSSSSKIRSSIQKVITNSEILLSQDIESVRTKMTTAKQTQSLKTARNYMILNLFKQGEIINKQSIKFSKIKFIDSKSLESFIISEIKNLIINSPEKILGYNHIYDYIITTIVPNYTFDEIDLDSLLMKNFKQVQKDYWSLL